MKARLHDEAEREVQQAFQFFESRRQGLGDEFVIAVDRAIAEISLSPERWPTLVSNIRRRVVRKFKYGVIYHVLDDEIEILAVMDLRRRPGYWRKRLRK